MVWRESSRCVKTHPSYNPEKTTNSGGFLWQTKCYLCDKNKPGSLVVRATHAFKEAERPVFRTVYLKIETIVFEMAAAIIKISYCRQLA